MKKITALTLGVLFITTGLSLAQQTPVAEVSNVQTIEVGNKHCPVSGREVGLMGPAIKMNYKGKIYHLCCPGCISIFNSNPEKYSKMAEDEAKTVIK